MKMIPVKEFFLNLIVIWGLMGICAGLAFANSAENAGYLSTQQGVVVRDSENECVRTGSWTPEVANPQCDPNALIQSKPTAAGPATPAVVAAAPEPAPEPALAPVPAPAPAAPAPQAMAAAPIVIAAAATPEPTPPAPVPAATPTRISLSVITLFDFDKATLKADGKSKLDQLAQDMRGAQFDTIVVTGYTDRIGSDEYNMKLSARRALAVKNYLTASAGVDPARISAAGKGKADPVTKPGECKGKGTAELIACLQPDRRVEVEVNGTR